MAPPGRTTAVVEGANYLLDLGVCNKRRRRGSSSIFSTAIRDIEDGQLDEAYSSLLHDIAVWEAPFAGEDDEDPTYVMFLENLKEFENVYMLDVSIEHGVSSPIKYEVENDTPAEFKRKIPSSRGSLIRERRSLDVDVITQSVQKDAVPQNDNARRDSLRKRKRVAANDELNLELRNSGFAKENILRRSPRIVEFFLNSRRNSELNIDVNGDMQSGLTHAGFQNEATDCRTLVRKRRSLVVEDELNSSLRNISFEKENTLRHSPRFVQNFMDAQKKKPDCKRRQGIDSHHLSEQGRACNSNADLVDESYRIFCSGFKVNGDSVHYEYGDGKRVFYEVSNQQRSANVEHEPHSLVVEDELNSSLRNISWGKKNTLRHSPRVVQNFMDAQKKKAGCKRHQGIDSHHLSEQGHGSYAKMDTVDESYKILLSGLKVVGSSVYCEYGDGKRVVYEADDQQRSANVEHEPQSSAPTPQPPTPPPRAHSAEEDNHMFGISKEVINNQKGCRRKYSSFWKEVEKDLRKPFEQKEYDDLWERVNVRKPISLHRETRSGGYKMEFSSQMGKSYLDLHSDLNQEIQKAKSDPYKVLNLLRGFFLYLKKIPHGVPKPWKDKHCKTIMPGTRCA